MSEEELNIQYICNKTLLDKDDELVPIILEMIKDSYKAGLNQSEFDNTMTIDLIEEIQELKKHLEIPKHCNLKTLEDYKSYYEDTSREQILNDTYIDYCAYVNLAHRYSELKKQLEEYKNDYFKLSKENNEYAIKLHNNKNQQKEFIEYLENMIKEMENTPADDIHQQVEKDSCLTVVNTILSKYKETIGDDK